MSEITVVIPTYNRAGTVGSAIDSVLQQESAPERIIVVNDGSSDNTADVLAGYGDKIKVIHQENGGLSAARNAGIAQASTEWVSFLDDDDEYCSGRIAAGLRSITAFPEATVHVSNVLLVSPEGTEERLFDVRGWDFKEATLIKRPLRWVVDGGFFAQTLVVKRSLLEKVGRFHSVPYEDLDLLVRMAPDSPWVIDPDPQIRVIRQAGDNASLSQALREKRVWSTRDLVRIFRVALETPGLTGEEQDLIQEKLATNLFELGIALIEGGDIREGKVCLREASTTFRRWRSRAKAAVAMGLGRLVTPVATAWSNRRRTGR